MVDAVATGRAATPAATRGTLPAVGPRPGNGRTRGGEAGHHHFRLLITDPFHPVTAPTMTALRRDCRDCRVIGVHSAVEAGVAPPGVDAVEQVPRPGSDDFVTGVLDVALRHGLTAVLPWTDRDALAVARERAVLDAAGVAVVCPPTPLVELACDKWATRQALDRLGVPVPEARLVHDGRELVDAARDLGHPCRRLMLKPRRLAGGRGVWRISDRADLTSGGPLPSLPLEAVAVALDLSPEPAVRDGFVVEHEVVGADTSVDVVALDGATMCIVARTRQMTLGGLSVAGQVMPPSDGVRAVAQTVVGQLGWSSLANLQLVEPLSGPPVVYEINPRAAGSVGLAVHAGADLLTAAIRLAQHGTVPDDLPDSVATVIQFRRYWHDHVWAPTPVAPASFPAIGVTR
jgi:carbamoylphosphate synthase large subunit